MQSGITGTIDDPKKIAFKIKFAFRSFEFSKEKYPNQASAAKLAMGRKIKKNRYFLVRSSSFPKFKALIIPAVSVTQPIVAIWVTSNPYGCIIRHYRLPKLV